MTTSQIQAEIAEYQDVLNDPEASSLAKELAAEEIGDLKAQLAKMGGDTPPAAADRPASRSRNPAKAGKAAPSRKYHPGQVFVGDDDRLEIVAFESAQGGTNFYLIKTDHAGQDSWEERKITDYIRNYSLKKEKVESQRAWAKRIAREEAAKKGKRPKKAATPYTGVHLDRDGHPLHIGDTVEVEMKGKTYEARLMSLRKLNGGGYGVKVVRDGKTLHPMLQPSAIRFVATGDHPEGRSATLDHMEPMPAKVVKSARTVRRADCDEPEAGILVTPTQITTIEAPMVADPAKGDKIFAHPDGTPMAVVKGSEVKKHFEDLGDAEPSPQPDGSVVFEATPEAEAAERETDKAEQPDRKIRAVKPPADCGFLKTEEEDANALQTFLEGMRQRWKSLDTHDKILRVLLRKSDRRVLLAIKRHNLIDFPIGTKYYSVCLNTGKLTKTEKPAQGEATVLHGQDKMRDFYRHPNTNTCRRASRELYVTCYRDGECDQAKRKRLLEIVNTNCRKREDEMSRAYRRYTHEKTADRWKGYKSDKSYYEVYREVIAALKAGKKV